MTETKKITAITINHRRRASQEKISQLCDSIQQVGLLNPITVTDWGVLVAGLHRLEACKKLGWTEISCNVIKEDDAELAEIDENLIRNELTTMERGELLARRKEIYEERYPETKIGNTVERQEVKRNDFALPPSFSADTAAKTGLTPRSIQQEVQIAKNIVPEVKEAIRETPIADRKTDLLHLARMEPAEQQEAVEKVTTGENKSISQYIKEQSKKDPDCKRIDREHAISRKVSDALDLSISTGISDYNEAIAIYFDWEPEWTVDECIMRAQKVIDHMTRLITAFELIKKPRVVKT